MAKKVNDLCVANGKYTDSQGNEKTQYENIGVEMENDDESRFILLKPHINLSGFEHSGRMVMVAKFASNSYPQPHQNSATIPVETPQTTNSGYSATEINLPVPEIDMSPENKQLDVF